VYGKRRKTGFTENQKGGASFKSGRLGVTRQMKISSLAHGALLVLMNGTR
jgi:hypothetical protein